MGLICPYAFQKILQKYGVTENAARAVAWGVYFAEKEAGGNVRITENKDYPWKKCINDQLKKYGSMDKAKKICGAIKAKYGSNEHDWGPRTERCIMHLKAQGYSKDKAIPICRKSTHDA